MASGSQNMTTYNARTVTGSNSAASPAGALLLSGAGRADNATGDTWLFLDSAGGTSTPWGIKHDQANNKIHIYGSNTDSIWTRMNTGDTYILGKVGIGYDPETNKNSYKLYVNGNSYFNGNTTHNGIDYFANGTTYYINNSAVAYLSDLRAGKVRLVDNWIGFYQTANAGDHRYGYIQANADRMYFRKENGVSTYGFDFNSHLYTTGNYHAANNGPHLSLAVSDLTNVKAANNGLSANREQGISCYSKDYGSWMGDFAQGYTQSNGQIWSRLYLRNYKTDGTTVNNYIYLYADKDGTTSYAIANQSAFRSAISAPSTTGSGASGTWGISITGNAATASKLVDSAHSWTATEVYNYMTARVLKAGDTMKGQLYINYDQDVGLNQNGSLIIGTKGGENIGIDGNEIMARSNSKASTLYLNSEGGNVYIGSGGITSVGTITSSAGYLKSTANGNTVTIGSQNTGWCHIQNSANISFYFNKSVHVDGSIYVYNSTHHLDSTAIYAYRWRTTNLELAELDANRMGLCNHGQGTAKGLNVGSLLVSNAWADASKVPTNGIYSKGGAVFQTNITNLTGYIKGEGDSYTNHAIKLGHNGDDVCIFYEYGSLWRFYTSSSGSNTQRAYIDSQGVHSAVWNDFAEYRAATTEEPGRVVISHQSGQMQLASQRLQPSGHVISDTFGCSVGESDKAKSPIAVAGRVLVYPYQNRNNYNIGDAVCTAPNGTVDIMTREEIIKYPDRIIGIVDEIPNYDVWQEKLTLDDANGEYKPIQVKGRIWIYVR